MTALRFLLAKWDLDIIWGYDGEDGKYVFVCLDVYSEEYNCHRINLKWVIQASSFFSFFVNKPDKSQT